MNRFRILTGNVLPILLGSAVYAFGLHYFVISNEFMEGGVTGFALLLNYVFGLPPSWSTLCLNIPLFALGWKAFGKSGIILTIVGTVGLSFFLWVMEQLIRYRWLTPFTTVNDYILAALYAGVFTGLGLGIVLRFGGTTGGTDIIARLGKKYRSWSEGQVILAIDVLVIGSSLLFLPQEKVLYSLVMVFVASRMIDFITKGAYAAKAFTVFTRHSSVLAERITRELERGLTLYKAAGGYSRTEMDVVYCVVSRTEMRKMKALIRSVDPNAFIIIHDVQEVLGEGFKTE
jgi:uncharacterized membrane-anchored protein YitT (DUF2179 family)